MDERADFYRYKPRVRCLAPDSATRISGRRIGMLYEQHKSLGDTMIDTRDEQQVTKRQLPLPADRISGKLRSVLALAEDTIETIKIPLQTRKDLLALSGDSVAARPHPLPS